MQNNQVSPGIEPGLSDLKSDVLTTTPQDLVCVTEEINVILLYFLIELIQASIYHMYQKKISRIFLQLWPNLIVTIFQNIQIYLNVS